ncbi:GNAT family protein [Lactobacillus sp. ESL0731]|uniref:GNAT family N-acetyltransferase n=1 Tax=unclassified Lactobacillus TaxID=2620435 RepID=UPI0023F88539|nr:MULTISPECIES: GNAT family protein [unclassified Lactobacillus]WEV51406.1 GNAT family protein [Lactobacillus sp. ESL0700]WEV62536.1 GNAT family protein [Lactobacillus sp. ESL0731]
MFTFDRFTVNDLKIELVLPELDQAPAILDLIAKDREELGRWLPWAETTKTVDDEANFIEMVREQMANYQMLALVIMVNGQVAGMLDLHNISRKDQCGEIGYWLGSAFQGQGIMTVAVKRLVKLAFTKMDFHRIDLMADHENKPSRAVAKHAGLEHVALLRAKVKYHGEFRDMDLYTIINEAN